MNPNTPNLLIIYSLLDMLKVKTTTSIFLEKTNKVLEIITLINSGTRIKKVHNRMLDIIGYFELNDIIIFIYSSIHRHNKEVLVCFMNLISLLSINFKGKT